MGNVLGTSDGGAPGRRVRRLDGKVVYTTCPECGCGPADCCSSGARACGWNTEGVTPSLRLTGSMRSRVWLYENCVRDGHPFRADGPQYHEYTVPLPLTTASSSVNCDLLGFAPGVFEEQRDPAGIEYPAITRKTWLQTAAISNGPAGGGGQSHWLELHSAFYREIPDLFDENPGPFTPYTWDWAFNSVIRIRLNNFAGPPMFECGDFSIWPALGGIPQFYQAIYGLSLFATAVEEIDATVTAQPIYSGRCVVGWTIAARREVVVRDTGPPQTVRGRYIFEFEGALTLDEVAGCAEDELPSETCLGATCLPDGTCEQMTQADAVAAGGQWYPNQQCEDIPCGCIPGGYCIVWGGVFTSAGGISAARIVAWDGTDWFALGAGFNAAVRSLCVHDGRLYAAGGFVSSGAATVRGVAVWNCDHWEEVGGGLVGTVNRIKSIDVPLRGRTLFAVGTFTAGGSNNVAWLEPSSNTWQPWTSGTNLEVYDCSANEVDEDLGAGEQLRQGNGLFVAGRFTTTGPGTLPLNNLGFDPQFQKLTLIEPTGSPGPAPNGRVRAVLSRFANAGSGGVITIGGVFTSVAGVAKGLVANLSYDPIDNRYETITGGPIGLGSGFFNGEVHALVWSNNQLGPDLYALGQFRYVSGAPTDAISKWNTTTQNWVTPTGYSGTFFHGWWGADPRGGPATLWLAGDTLRVVDGQSGRAAVLEGSQVNPIAGHLMNGQAFAVIGFDFGNETPPVALRMRGGCAGCGSGGEGGIRELSQ